MTDNPVNGFDTTITIQSVSPFQIFAHNLIKPTCEEFVIVRALEFGSIVKHHLVDIKRFGLAYFGSVFKSSIGFNFNVNCMLVYEFLTIYRLSFVFQIFKKLYNVTDGSFTYIGFFIYFVCKLFCFGNNFLESISVCFIEQVYKLYFSPVFQFDVFIAD